MNSTTIQKATAVQDAITDCVNNLKYLGKCVDELVDGAVSEEEMGDIKQAAKWLGEGKRVKRAHWRDAALYAYGGQIWWTGAPANEDRLYDPWCIDLLADDWVVVK